MDSPGLEFLLKCSEIKATFSYPFLGGIYMAFVDFLESGFLGHSEHCTRIQGFRALLVVLIQKNAN